MSFVLTVVCSLYETEDERQCRDARGVRRSDRMTRGGGDDDEDVEWGGTEEGRDDDDEAATKVGDVDAQDHAVVECAVWLLNSRSSRAVKAAALALVMTCAAMVVGMVTTQGGGGVVSASSLAGYSRASDGAVFVVGAGAGESAAATIAESTRFVGNASVRVGYRRFGVRRGAADAVGAPRGVLSKGYLSRVALLCV